MSTKKDKHTITLSLESGAVTQEATADNVETYVKFHVKGKYRKTDFGHTEDHYIEVVSSR